MMRPGDLRKLLPLAALCLAVVAGCGDRNGTTPGTPRVKVVVDGGEQEIETRAETVGELLAQVGIELGELDRLDPAEYTPITDGLTITIVRVHHEVVQGEEVVIPYERQIVQDLAVPAGESRILEPGQNGIEQVIYRVVYEDDVEVERIAVRRITLQEARPETVLVGVRERFTPTPITGTLAYLTGNTEVGFNAWVMQGSSGAQRRLTSDGTLDTRVFALSPDGTQLLFTRRTSETLASGQLNSLWVLDTQAEEAEPVDVRLTDLLWADWSPDGETIAYSTGEVTVSAPGWQAHNDLWTARLNPQGRLVNRRQVLEASARGAFFWWGTQYAWSPNRRFIAYAQADNVGFIRVSDGRRTELQRFAPLNTYSNWVWVPELSWSPDGRFLISVIHGAAAGDESPEDSQVFDMWVFDTESPLAVKQVNESGIWATPAWSPGFAAGEGESRGSQVAYAQARSPKESVGSGYDLYVMDRDGSNRRRVFPAEGELGLKSPRVAWGPTGRQLVTIQQGDLYLVDLTQNGDVQVRRLTIDSSVQTVEWGR